MTKPTPDERAELITSMAVTFAQQVNAAMGPHPDLVEGFLAGRYVLVIDHDSLTVMAREDEHDIGAELAGGG